MINLTRNYDLKKILLGENYSNENSIINILLAKSAINYRDKSDDYFKYSEFKRGHIENYKLIDNIFKKIFLGFNTEHKDIMNSFWTTYKCYLQIMYPEIFLPEGTIRKGDKIPLKNPKKNNLNSIIPNIKYPPYTSENLKKIHGKYLNYYKKKFPFLKVYEGMEWVGFLIENFDFFPKVNNSDELKKFAVLTHSIGNLAIVPQGFNTGRKHNDYWDMALKLLQNNLRGTGEWKKYIDINFYNCYVDKNYNVNFYFERNYKNKSYLPQDEEEIISFLKWINLCIEIREKNIIDKLNKKY